MERAALIHVHMICCNQKIMIVSNEPIYASRYFAVGVRLSMVELAAKDQIEIVEGKGFAAVVDGRVSDTAKLKRFRVRGMGDSKTDRCGIYCKAAKDLFEMLSDRQKAAVQTCPWSSDESVSPLCVETPQGLGQPPQAPPRELDSANP